MELQSKMVDTFGGGGGDGDTHTQRRRIMAMGRMAIEGKISAYRGSSS